ncbi:hypothetical protein [Archangium violaceum]|uniref:Tetratricopeptide repeat protein n=1 Tax=Archangium violaceum Cb vi76 TaxID=1406225 RepID=A0A084SSH9_9BACT|nr:hypothetical protein [Archangium violaceum]KFA91414.1 hypothetical protein Q664_21590 [Archangium violaceum Cb vi76]
MSGQDEVMRGITEAIERGQRGEREEARRMFAEIWKELSPDGDPFHRCLLSHYMADLQDDPHEELAWDLRALEAADLVPEERARSYHETLSVKGFYPSLHLNLAEDYRKVGDLARAREHVARARDSVEALGDDGYARMIRAGIERLARQLPSE